MNVNLAERIYVLLINYIIKAFIDIRSILGMNPLMKRGLPIFYYIIHNFVMSLHFVDMNNSHTNVSL